MKFIIPAASLLVALAIACNNTLQKAPSPEEKQEAFKDGAMSADSTRADEVAAGNQIANGTGQPKLIKNADWDKKIVKTADVSVDVRNFQRYTERLHEKVKAAGGYIAQEEQSANGYKIENTVRIMVPVERFDETVMQLAADSDRLVNKKISSEDVTAEVIDTKSRLETKKEVRERYLELLKQAHSVKDILAVQEEINGIQEDLDAAAGRIAYLSHAATYSTINLTFYQVLDPTVKNDAEPGFLHKIGNAFKDGWNWASLLVIGLVNLWPLLLTILLAVMWLRKRRAPKKVDVKLQSLSQGNG